MAIIIKIHCNEGDIMDEKFVEVVEKKVISADYMSSVRKSLETFKFDASVNGAYRSKKMNKRMKFYNNMEYIFLKWLDINPRVLEFFSENLDIPYYLGDKCKTFHPDYEVIFEEGKKVGKAIWELKVTGGNYKTAAKAEAGKEYAAEHGYDEFKIITIGNMMSHIQKYSK